MRRFEFRLDAVLRWRTSELEIEEARLRNVLAELACLRTSIAELDAEQGPQRSVVHSPAATAGERLALDHWIRWARLERECRVAKIADCERRIDAQRARLMEARRKLQLLKKLRGRRESEWAAELRKEIEEIAAEACAARSSRR
jgi:flagellar export protein FliJ